MSSYDHALGGRNMCEMSLARHGWGVLYSVNATAPNSLQFASCYSVNIADRSSPNEISSVLKLSIVKLAR